MSFIQKLIIRRFLQPAHQMKASQFEELKPPAGAVVFLGDSITAGGAWHEWFPQHSVVNRGIDGDTSDGVRKRTKAALGDAPGAVSLLIGTNDIAIGRSSADITADVKAIISLIRDRAPQAPILVHGILPRQAKYRARITELNALYRVIADNTGGATFVDLWPAFAESDRLRTDFTRDGLHLNGAGYHAWVNVIRPLLPAPVH